MIAPFSHHQFAVNSKCIIRQTLIRFVIAENISRIRIDENAEAFAVRGRDIELRRAVRFERCSERSHHGVRIFYRNGFELGVRADRLALRSYEQKIAVDESIKLRFEKINDAGNGKNNYERDYEKPRIKMAPPNGTVKRLFSVKRILFVRISHGRTGIVHIDLDSLPFSE